MDSEKQELQQTGVDGATTPCSLRQIVLPHSSQSPSSSKLTLDDILAGWFYEIGHVGVSFKYPDQLKQIRIVMVSDKTQSGVSLRFPSIYSLRSHFSSITAAPQHHQWGAKKLPQFDEKHVIRSDHACDLLLRRIAPTELAEKKMAWGFWVAQSTSTLTGRANLNRECDVDGMSTVVSKRGSCWSELKRGNMVTWGKRRQVRFLSRHEEIHDDNPDHKPPPLSQCHEGTEEKGGDSVPEQTQTDEYEGKSTVRVMTKATRERKRCGGSRTGSTLMKRSRRSPIPREQVQGCTRSRRRTGKDSIKRWSAERYKLAEENMLKILKEKGAVFGNPILRPALRLEARKLIGDTGLLDHLLKHMSGRLAPGREERFRRRHNADGMMEYWLEAADLVNVRREAGVDDPFWTPPPGWKLGDSPCQDPVCARELKDLREEIAMLKRKMEELASKRQGEELVVVTTPTSCVTCSNLEREVSVVPLKEMCDGMTKRMAEMAERIREIELTLNGPMEVRVERLESAPESDKSQSVEAMVQLSMANVGTAAAAAGGDKKKEAGKKGAGTTTASGSEMMRTQKAEKLQRLRSGFRICKPQGSFQWPVPTPQPAHTVVPVENLITVPTPPSVSSSSATAVSPLTQPSPPPAPQAHPASPVRPRPVIVHSSLSPLVSGQDSLVDINLNDVPISFLNRYY